MSFLLGSEQESPNRSIFEFLELLDFLENAKLGIVSKPIFPKQ